MFGLLDLVLLLFVAVCVFMGAYRGLIGSIVKLLGGALKLVVAVLLVKPFVALISLTKIDERMFDKLSLKFSGISDKFNVNLAEIDPEELNVFVGDALSDAKIPRIFRGFFSNIFSVNPETIAANGDVTLAQLMGVAVSNMMLMAISFIVLFASLWLIVKLVSRWSIKKAKGDTVFAKTNKWLGALFGFVKSVLILFIVFICFSFFKDFTFLASVFNLVNKSFLGRLLLKISQAIIDSSFDIKRVLEGWLIKG